MARRSFPERSTLQRAGFSPALPAVNQISRPFAAQHGTPAISVQPADRIFFDLPSRSITPTEFERPLVSQNEIKPPSAEKRG